MAYGPHRVHDGDATKPEDVTCALGDLKPQLMTGDVSGPVAAKIQNAGFEIRTQIIWTKPHFVLSCGDYHWAHEPAFVCVRKGASSHWRGDRTQSTVWPVATLNPFGGKN